MEALKEKIYEYTLDGPPSVGQLIALQELAKKVGVNKNDLEKLIEEAVASNKVAYEALRTSIDNRPSYERPSDVTFEKSRMDFPERRDLFDRQETKQSTASDELLFNRPELTFGKVELDFGTSQTTADKFTSDKDSGSILKNEPIGIPVVEQKEETVDSKHPVKETPPENIPLSYDQKIAEIKGALIELNQVIIERGYPFSEEEYLHIQNQLYAKYGLPPLRSLTEAIVHQPTFDAPKIQAPSSPASDVQAFTQSQEEIERQLKIVKQKEEEKYRQKLEEKKLMDKQSNETANRSTFEVSKSIGSTAVLGWIAAGVSILLFPFIGVIMGIVTISKAKEVEKKVVAQNLVLATEDVNKLKTSRTMGLIAIFVGVGKLIFMLINYGSLYIN
jgi:hypothetical protein